DQRRKRRATGRPSKERRRRQSRTRARLSLDNRIAGIAPEPRGALASGVRNGDKPAGRVGGSDRISRRPPASLCRTFAPRGPRPQSLGWQRPAERFSRVWGTLRVVASKRLIGA